MTGECLGFSSFLFVPGFAPVPGFVCSLYQDLFAPVPGFVASDRSSLRHGSLLYVHYDTVFEILIDSDWYWLILISTDKY